MTGAAKRQRLQTKRKGEGQGSPFFVCARSRGIEQAFACMQRTTGRGRASNRPDPSVHQSRQPIFNVPTSLVIVLALLLATHLLRLFVLTPRAELEFLLLFAFIPVRYDPTLLVGGAMPGGLAADVWTFVTYALIHADFMHLGFNAVWLLAFGTPLARRFDWIRFCAFLAVTAAAGAAAHLFTHAGETVPMVGASAAISGAMAASMRFAFQRGGPLWSGRGDLAAYRAPALPLASALRDERVLIFLAIWFGLNFIFGLGVVSLAGDEQSVAWQAHVGGFVAGLVLFGLFDPVRAPPDSQPPAAASA